MSPLSLRLLAAGAMFAGLTLTVIAEEKKADDGFKPLFNGKDLSGFKTFNVKDDTFKVVDGVIHCNGKPNGYFYTDKPYKNYTIRYDWRYPAEQPEKTSLNSGLLVHIQEPHKVWPYSIEAQGAYANHGTIYFVSFPKDAANKMATHDAEARKKALKAKEEWHTTEMTCNADGTFVVKINGIEVSKGKSDLKEGAIGWQSEGAAIQFRNIKIKEMK